MYKNHEGYPDPTQGQAIREADRPPEQARKAVQLMLYVARWCGYEVVGRIRLKDRETGREWD